MSNSSQLGWLTITTGVGGEGYDGRGLGHNFTKLASCLRGNAAEGKGNFGKRRIARIAAADHNMEAEGGGSEVQIRNKYLDSRRTAVGMAKRHERIDRSRREHERDVEGNRKLKIKKRKNIATAIKR